MGLLLRHDNSDNESVETKSFAKNENEHHSDVQARLLSRGTHTSITHNSNACSSSETSETARQTSAEIDHALKEGVASGSAGESLSIQNARGGAAGVETSGDNDGNNESVNGDDTSENNGDNSAHHKLGLDH